MADAWRQGSTITLLASLSELPFPSNRTRVGVFAFNPCAVSNHCRLHSRLWCSGGWDSLKKGDRLRMIGHRNAGFGSGKFEFLKRKKHALQSSAADENQESSPRTTSSSEIADASNSEYDGLLDAINNSTKWIVSLSVLFFVVWFHDLNVAWFVIGSIWNGVLAKVLKKWINQPRPNSASLTKSDPGMPSSHSQSVFFIVTYAIVSLIHLQGVSILSTAISISLYACAAFMSWLRVNRGLHTYEQIFVGSIIGLTNGLLWNKWYIDYIAQFSVSGPFEAGSIPALVYSSALVSVILFGLEVKKRWLKSDYVN